METKFNVGDIVIGVEEFDDNENIIGVTGIVREIDECGRYGIEFDDNIGGHNLSGHCKSGYGWYCDGCTLEHYQSAIENHTQESMSYDEVMS